MASESKKIHSRERTAGRSGAMAAAARRRTGADPDPLTEISANNLTPAAHSAVGRLMDELDRLREELTDARKRVSELENRAEEDALLPVLNRRGFGRELERTLAYVKRHRTDVSLIYVDLDDFKSINDVHGHAAGDAALMHLTDILIANVRRSDVVGRLGGDEFAVLLHRANEKAAMKKADQLASALASSGLVFEGKEIPMSLTAGTTQLRSGDTSATALGRADKLMYAGKTHRKRAQGKRHA